MRRPPRGPEAARTQDTDGNGWNAAVSSPPAASRQLSPLERHVVPDDKLVLFELAPVHRLAGTWQGPGTLAQLRREAP
jgi:hypothetical protein